MVAVLDHWWLVLPGIVVFAFVAAPMVDGRGSRPTSSSKPPPSTLRAARERVDRRRAEDDEWKSRWRQEQQRRRWQERQERMQRRRTPRDVPCRGCRGFGTVRR